MGESLARVLGRRLALARVSAALSQVALSRAAGLSVGMVSLVENGGRLPSLASQLAWTKACGTTLAQVYEGLEAELSKRGGR